MILSPILIPGGLLIYDCTAQAHTFWLIPDAGIAIFSCGIIVRAQAMQAYLMDSFLKHVASASAASQLLRSLASFDFPLFAPKMYEILRYS